MTMGSLLSLSLFLFFLLRLVHCLSTSTLKPKQEFLAHLASSLQQDTLLKCTLISGPASSMSSIRSDENSQDSPIALLTNELKSLSFRPVMVKKELKMQCLFSYKTNVITKNYKASLDEDDQLLELLNAAMKKCKSGTIETLDKRVELVLKRGDGKIRIKDTSNEGGGTKARDLSHDRKKNSIIDPKEPFLVELGIMSSQGKPLAGMSDKYRQIQKFTEIITSLVEKSVPFMGRNDDDINYGSNENRPKKLQIRLTDMGCGLGYLTFAAHASLTKLHDDCCTIGISFIFSPFLAQ